MRLLSIVSILLLIGINQLSAQTCLGINVNCRPQPAVVECECDISPINPAFMDFESLGNEDIVAFEGLGFSVTTTGDCGNIIVRANDREVHPTSCSDTFFIERVYQVESLFGGPVRTCIDTFKTEFIPPNFLVGARSDTITCQVDVAVTFQDYIDNFSFTEFLPCYPETQIRYINNVDPVLAAGCGGNASVRPLVELLGPCTARCADMARDISNFVVLDTFQSVITCPPNPPALDISNLMIDDIITDLLDDFTLEFMCMEPVVTNNYSMDSIQFVSCDPDDLTITINADEDCSDNSSSCQFTVEITNNVLPEITFIPDTLKLECGAPDNDVLVNDWLRMAQALSSQGIVINLNNTNDVINNITHTFDFNVLDDPICNMVFDITFEAFDNCSRSITQNGVIIIEDTQSPSVVFCPADLQVNADDTNRFTIVDDWINSYAAMDNCNPNPIISNNFDSGILGFNCGNVDTLITFLVNDLCNEIDSLECKATLSIMDNVMDIFSGVPNDTVIQCENPVNRLVIEQWFAGISAANTLGVPFPVGNDIDFFDAQFTDCTGEVTVTFAFENDCGIMRDTTASIQITDDIPPTIGCPQPITFEGSFDEIEDDIDAWLETANPMDNCTATSGRNFSSRLFENICDTDTVTQPITFYAIDGCGNMSANNCSVDLTIISDKSPLITCPPQLTLECGTPSILDSIVQWLTFEGSNFSGTPISATSDFNPTNFNAVVCGDNTVVNFTVEDLNCNRSISCMSTIRIEDTLNPEITCPGNITINSTAPDAQFLLNDWIFSTTFGDNGCSSPDFFTDPVFDQTGVDFCELQTSSNVQFTVIDMCGLQNACIGLLTINNAPPTINCPSNNLNLECGDINNDALIADWLEETTAMSNALDDLSTVVSHDFNTSFVDTCFQSVPVVFTVQDICGKENTCTMNIVLSDTKAPVVNCPTNPLNLLAGDTLKIPKFEAFLELIAIDVEDCNEVILTDDFDESQLDGFSCEEEDFDARLTFTDACGLISNCQIEISIQNNIQTTFINCVPGADDFTVECGNPNYESEIREWMALVTAEDVFGLAFPTTPNLDFSNPELFQCAGFIPITFELVDLCDNSQSCALNLFIEDNTPPEITTCPSDTSLVLESPSFDSDVETWLQTIVSRDNCISNLTTNDSYTRITSLAMCQASEDVPVVFTVLDGCNNTTNCLSTLTVTTDRVPTISCPGNLTVECGDSDNQMIINNHISSVEGLDPDGNNLDPDFSFDITELQAFDCDGVIPILFTIEDNCNIQDTCSLLIILEDTTAPTAICPTPITVNSTDPDGSMLMLDWIDSFTTSDNCSDPLEQIQNGFAVPTTLCNSEEEMNIEFYAEDACGIRDTCIATITINKAAPEITCNNNLDIQCGEDGNDMVIAAWINSITATNNNGNIIPITDDFMQANFDNACENEIIVTFTAIDECGEPSVDCLQTISQVDTIAPAITLCPQSIVIDVEEPNLMASVTNWREGFSAMDLCNSAKTSDDFNLSIDAFDCGSAQTVIFTAIDECDNINTDCTANISFENRRDVDIICPEPIQVNCNEPGSLIEVQRFLLDFIAVSEDPIFDVTNNIDIDNLPLDCSDVITQAVTITLVDNCGNTAECPTSIEYLPAARVFIPNIFNPSLGGDDAFFAIRTNIAVQEIESMRIYSRWGDLMFERENFDPNAEQGWDGRNRFGKQLQGVYTYRVVYQDIFGNPFEEIGTLTLL